MNFSEWKPYYQKISADFGFSEKQDRNAAFLLESLLINHPGFIHFSSIRKIIENKTVTVIGAGPAVSDQIEHHQDMITSSVMITADGATSAALKVGFIPDIIVSDLDGCIDDQIKANKKGCIIVAHAHGDNQHIIQEIVPKIMGKITGSIQIDPSDFSHVANVGGFTDGDRAVFLADHFNARTISLLGFNFTGSIGSFSLPEKKDRILKRRKLLWAERLIKMINTNKRIQILD